jgi:hypothetical protein
VLGEPAWHRPGKWRWLDRLLVPGCGERGAGPPGPIRRVTQHLQAGLLSGHQLDAGWPVGGVGRGQRTLGEQPGLRLGRDVGLVAVALVRAGLAGMARLRVDGGAHPILGNLAGDPPGPRPLARLHILAGNQREQRHRLGLLGGKLDTLHRRQHRQRIVDQPGDQRLPGLGSSQAHTGLPGWS